MGWGSCCRQTRYLAGGQLSEAHACQLFSFARHYHETTGEELDHEDMLAIVGTYIDEVLVANEVKVPSDDTDSSQFLSWLFKTFEIKKPKNR